MDHRIEGMLREHAFHGGTVADVGAHEG